MKKMILVVAFFMSTTAMAFTFGPPRVESVSLEKARPGSWTSVEMADSEYVVLRVAKKARGSLVKAKITDEGLAQCNVVAIDQGRDTVIADVFVSFEPELDDGRNGCEMEIRSGRKVFKVELFLDIEM